MLQIPVAVQIVAALLLAHPCLCVQSGVQWLHCGVEMKAVVGILTCLLAGQLLYSASAQLPGALFYNNTINVIHHCVTSRLSILPEMFP